MITPETASQALSSWLAYLQITQETATQLITRAFLEQPARPEIAVHRIERDDGTVDYDAWRRNRINIFQRWRKRETMAHELQLIKQSSGILIPATPETSDILQSKIKLGAVLVAEFRQVRNPAFHRRFFALLNLGFEYWEPTGGAISANERKLVNGYAKFLAAYGGNESALLDAAEQYLEQIANRRVTNGISLCKSFDAYRAWVTVEAGHYDAIQGTSWRAAGGF